MYLEIATTDITLCYIFQCDLLVLFFQNIVAWCPILSISSNFSIFMLSSCILCKTTDYGRPVRKLPSLHSQKSNPNPKFLGTAEAYFVCHIGPNFQIYLIYAFIGCP